MLLEVVALSEGSRLIEGITLPEGIKIPHFQDVAHLRNSLIGGNGDVAYRNPALTIEQP